MPSYSLSGKILAMILAASTLMTTVLTVISLYLDYRTEMNLLERSYEQLERLTILPLSAAVWSFDDEQIRKFLESIVMTGDFVEARLVDGEGALIFETQRNCPANFASPWLAWIAGDLSYSKTLTLWTDRVPSPSPVLGHLTIKSSKVAVITRLSQKLLVIFSMQALKTLVVSLIILVIVEKLLTRHLRQVASYLTSLCKQNFRQKSPLQLKRRAQSADELTTLVDNLNTLTRELNHYQDAHEEQLKLTQRELEIQRMSALHSARLASLGELAGGIAHEINNPLAIIMGSAERLTRELRRSNYPQVQQCTELILRTGDRIAKVISSLRKLARDGQDSPRNSFDLERLIQEVVILSEEKLRHQSIQLIIKVEPGMEVFANEVEISQVLFNLLSNAIDAVENSPERWIQIEAKAMPGGVLLAVTDSGPGIPGHLSARIMEPFFTTKDIGKGTGLGLSISLSIAKRHGGDLRLNGENNHTSFELWLPQSKI